MTKNYLLVCLLILFVIPTYPSTVLPGESSLKITWFGSSCIVLSDGKDSILFDPFFTRASMWEVVSFQKLKSHPGTVKNWLSKVDVESISAIVTSHTHYDHVLDLVEAEKLTKAKIFGSVSTKNIALGGGVLKNNISIIDKGAAFKVGDFTIDVKAGEHPPHFLGLTLAAGKITTPLKPGASAYSYKKDQDFSFFISHPKGNVFFHPSGNSTLVKKDMGNFKANLVILGVANRKSSADLLEKVVAPVDASIIIPVHFDNIFTPLEKGPEHLFGVDMNEFYQTTHAKMKSVEIKTLNVGETFNYIN